MDEICARLDWVRPVAGFMRLQGVPEAVVQSTMTFLLSQLDEHLDGETYCKLILNKEDADDCFRDTSR